MLRSLLVRDRRPRNTNEDCCEQRQKHSVHFKQLNKQTNTSIVALNTNINHTKCEYSPRSAPESCTSPEVSLDLCCAVFVCTSLESEELQSETPLSQIQSLFLLKNTQ